MTNVQSIGDLRVVEKFVAARADALDKHTRDVVKEPDAV